LKPLEIIYANHLLENIKDMKKTQFNPLYQFGLPLEIVKIFGSIKQYTKALAELKRTIYRKVA